MYVALSRVTNMEGLYLLGKYSRDALRVDIRAAEEYQRLKQESPFTPLDNIVTL